MRIASQHKWKDAEYRPQFEWPGETLVQWGGKGVVLGLNSYTTAFFEAFPEDKMNAGGFIRGEGKTIADAESDAWTKFERQSNCQHLWGRENYRNGGQLCRHCRAFQSGVLKPVSTLGSWRTPIEYFEERMIYGPEGIAEYEALMERPYVESKYVKKLRLRRSVFGVTERPNET